MNELGSALVIIALFGFLALLIKWGGMGKYAELQRLHEIQKQILDKIGSGPQMIQFIESKEGKELLDRLKVSPPVHRKADSSSALHSVNQQMGTGFILAGGGIGLLITNYFHPAVELLMWGCILTSAGIGLLITSGIAYRQYRKWGVIQRETAATPGSPSS